MEPVSGLKAYEQFGVAGLFIVMYLGTVWFLIRQLVSQKNEAVQQAIREATALEASTKTIAENTVVMLELKKTNTELNKTVAEHFAYIKARDEFRDERRR